MLGVMIKDFYLSIKQLKWLIFAFIALSYAFNNTSSVIGFISLYSILLLNTTYSYDSMVEWNKYSITLPIKRSHIVLSKYLLIIPFTLLFILSSMILPLLNISSFSINEIIVSDYYSFIATIILTSIYSPIIIKFGITNARILSVIILILTFSFAGIIKEIIPFSLIPYLLPISLVLLFISYLISVKIINNKDF